MGIWKAKQKHQNALMLFHLYKAYSFVTISPSGVALGPSPLRLGSPAIRIYGSPYSQNFLHQAKNTLKTTNPSLHSTVIFASFASAIDFAIASPNP